MRPTRALALAAALAGAGAAPAGAACRQALALGLDVSGSVDPGEYRLQMDGLAAALGDPQVRAAFLSMPQAPVSLAIFEWSGPGAQRLLVDWTVIDGPARLDAVSVTLLQTGRAALELSTALGEAKAFGIALLADRPDCWKHVLDLSGDGKSNTGPAPEAVAAGRVVVNGLVIGDPLHGAREGPSVGELSAYYRMHVIAGPDAFVETAVGFESFQEAMTRKLLRELEVMVLSAR